MAKLRARSAAGAPTPQPSEEDAASRRAEKYALDLLSRRPRTMSDVAMRLEARGYSEPVVTGLLGRLERAGYLDDYRFARSWLEERNRAKPCGRARLRRELITKGVTPTIASEVLAEVITAEMEEDLAVRAARKKSGPGGPQPGPETRRLWDFLRRRGFGAGACRAALTAVAGPRHDDDEWPLQE